MIGRRLKRIFLNSKQTNKMAGDWIKIEISTPDKPEVAVIARKLKLDPDSVVGKLIRIWAWADLNSVDGNEITVTETFLDRITHKRGFARAMRECGWLTGQDGCLTFPGFYRHNGRTAKERSETNRRVADHRKRNGNVTPNTLQKPLPEKSIEKRVVSSDEDTTAAAADQARTLCILHPSRALTMPALTAARAAIQRHGFEAVRAGTAAYAAAVGGWTPAERLQFVTNPERFFSEDTWNQPPENWNSRTAARRAITPERQTVNVGGRKPNLHFDHLPKELQPQNQP